VGRGFVMGRTQALHARGVVRVAQRPDGAGSISCVRIVNRGVQKKSLDMTPEEFAGLRELFGWTETPSVQLVLDLPRSRSEAKPEMPLPKGPSHAKPRRYWFPRHRGARRGRDV
jgi:hypothetical protein